MQMLDATILNTALPSIAASLNISPLRTHAVVIAYMLTVGTLIPASGWLADRYGTRRIFLYSIIIFTLGSLACALSSTLEMLTAARVFQGVGGALLVPVGRLSILRAFPRKQLVKALSFITIPGLIGPLLGPTLGGMFVYYASWHWIFLVNIPVGLLGLVLTRLYMPSYPAPTAPPRFDYTGFLLFGGFMIMITLSLEGMGETPLPKSDRIVFFLAGIACIFTYGLYSLKAKTPLFSPTLFKTRNFTVGIIGNIISRLGMGAVPFLTPLLLQVGLGYDPVKAGLTMLPLALGAMLGKSCVNRLITIAGYRKFLFLNTLLVSLMLAAFSLIDQTMPYPGILLFFLLAGLINSLQYTGMNTITLIDLPEADSGSGNSLLSAVMQLSMSMGVALAASILDSFTTSGRGVHAAFHGAFLILGAMGALSSLVFAKTQDTAHQS